MTIDLEKQIRRRIRVLIVLFLILFSGIVLRLFYLQIMKYSFFKQKSVAQQQHSIKIAANRGTIYDRNKKVLATSIDTLSIYATPKYISDKQTLASQLAPLLKCSATELHNKMNNDRYFVWLARKMDPTAAETIKSMKLPGVGFVSEQKRIYPRKAFAAHLLGFVGIDDTGLGGIEQFFDPELGGEPGQLIVDKTPYGDEIYCGLRTLRPAVNGSHVQLTIDEFIQFTAERSLKKAVATWKAKGGTIIVSDPRTGEILALACTPDFDPNEYGKVADTVRVNTAVQTVYEPGSTLKAITMAAAFDAGAISDSTRIFNGATFKVDNKYINDLHAEKAVQLNASYSPLDILVFSLNIGTAKIGLMLGKDKLYQYLTAFGFGKKTDIQLPGESAGLLRLPADWKKTDEAMIPFGHAIAVTPIQMISAMNCLANKGVPVKPTLFKRVFTGENKLVREYTAPKPGKQVISTEIAEKILGMMKETVDRDGGTGMGARIPGYSVAGKTGTAEKADQFGKGYIKNEYMASFVGVVPANQPKLSILVILDTPRYGMYGGTVAAPVFKEVAEAILYYMNISPDRSRVVMVP